MSPFSHPTYWAYPLLFSRAFGAAIFELVSSLAERFGVQIAGSEIVGLVPMEALTDAAEFYLRLQGFGKDQTLERELFEKSIQSHSSDN